MEEAGSNKPSQQSEQQSNDVLQSSSDNAQKKSRKPAFIAFAAIAGCLIIAITAFVCLNQTSILTSAEKGSSSIASSQSDSSTSSSIQANSENQNSTSPAVGVGSATSDTQAPMSSNDVLSNPDAGQASDNPDEQNSLPVENQAAEPDATQVVQAIPPAADDPRIQTSKSANKTKPEKRVVYLTFDDGPSDMTPKILKTLKDNDVKATWFVTGSHSNLDRLPEIWNEGHQIALHSDSHNYKKIYKSSKAFFKDMAKISKKVEARIGVSPTLIRFPGGSINSYDKKVYKKIIKKLKKKNWHYFDWNASIEDSATPRMRSTKVLYSNMRKSSRGKHSICLLMHDTNSKRTTAKVLNKVIKYYKKRGYDFKYLDANSYGYHF